jgi:hypothetical protein
MLVFSFQGENIDQREIENEIKRKNIQVYVYDDRDDVPFKLEVDNDVDDKQQYQDIYEGSYFL